MPGFKAVLAVISSIYKKIDQWFSIPSSSFFFLFFFFCNSLLNFNQATVRPFKCNWAIAIMIATLMTLRRYFSWRVVVASRQLSNKLSRETDRPLYLLSSIDPRCRPCTAVISVVPSCPSNGEVCTKPTAPSAVVNSRKPQTRARGLVGAVAGVNGVLARI